MGCAVILAKYDQFCKTVCFLVAWYKLFWIFLCFLYILTVSLNLINLLSFQVPGAKGLSVYSTVINSVLHIIYESKAVFLVQYPPCLYSNRDKGFVIVV